MTSVSELQARKSTVLRGRADLRNMISGLEDKVSRLRQASTRLAKYMQSNFITFLTLSPVLHTVINLEIFFIKHKLD